MLTNWVGLNIHPTDEYVHWSEKNPKETMQKLRNAYDAIAELGQTDNLRMLLEAADHCARCDAAEEAAGESL